MVHDGHPVAQLVGFLHVVSGEHDRLTFGVEAREQLPQCQTSLGIEPGRGLVKEEHRGRWKMARATMSRWAIPPESA